MTTFQKVKIKDLLEKVKGQKKVPKGDYLPNGRYKIIDQGEGLVNGYTNEESLLYKGPMPVIIFGDHTCRLKFIKSPFCLGADGTQLMFTKKINQTYFYYALKSLNFKISAYQRHYKLIKEKSILYPENKETQNHIVSVLSSYDDLIENNEKRIKTLEEMAQLLYTEWFVKFKFPGHEKVKIIDSGTEYGKIPHGWDVKKLSEVASFVRGCSYSSEEINDYVGDYYIVNLKSFNRGGGFRFDGAKYYSGKTKDNQILKAGDIVVAVTDMTNDRAVIARPARVPELTGNITLSADVVKINSDILPSSFIYELLSSYRFTETTKQKANGANVLHLKPAAILEFIALIPDAKSLKAFDIYCKPTINEVDKLLKQNDVLIKTRDLLIPQLVTGKRELK